MNKLSFILILISCAFFLHAQHNIIPIPVEYNSNEFVFEVPNQLMIKLNSPNKQLNNYAQQLSDYLVNAGIRTVIVPPNSRSMEGQSILLNLEKSSSNPDNEEGYTLEVNAKDIIISANEAPGIFNGIQTLKQLMPSEFESGNRRTAGPYQIKGCNISDYPRFEWRGLMLDVSRHFFSVEDVKLYIDQMVKYKFNTFHWHLTDDEGWRIEIKSLPKLTEVGAWRVERHGRFGDTRPYPKEGEEATYGGFYTHDEIREVVQYAKQRNVTIVPEIDIPGHSMAALAAYPELSTLKEPHFVNPGSKFAEWFADGTFEMLIENTINPADEAVYTFLDKVFTEVAELFPGQYIHMGGDECYRGFWERDPSVQAFMKENGMENSHDLEVYFIERVEKIVRSKGKSLIGWDEIVAGELSKDAAVMNWQSPKIGMEAAAKGYKVVMCQKAFCYLDYTQGDPSVENKIYQDLSLEKTYSFDPAPEGVDEQFVLGGQGNLWTEVIPNIQYGFHMTYPRALAIAESVWSPKENKNWDDFFHRTEAQIERFAAAGNNISQAMFDPIIEMSEAEGKMICTLTSVVPNGEIFYTIDNTYPVQFGEEYSGPIVIPEGNLSLRTQVFRDGKALGRMLQIHRDDLQKRIPK